MTLRKINALTTVFIPAVLILGCAVGFSGCAHKPCPIIPAQLELAEARLERARGSQKDSGEDLVRLQQNIERLEKSIADLEAEKAILEELIKGSEEEE